jgi:hypothetical protein
MYGKKLNERILSEKYKYCNIRFTWDLNLVHCPVLKKTEPFPRVWIGLRYMLYPMITP